MSICSCSGQPGYKISSAFLTNAAAILLASSSHRLEPYRVRARWFVRSCPRRNRRAQRNRASEGHVLGRHRRCLFQGPRHFQDKRVCRLFQEAVKFSLRESALRPRLNRLNRRRSVEMCVHTSQVIASAKRHFTTPMNFQSGGSISRQNNLCSEIPLPECGILRYAHVDFDLLRAGDGYADSRLSNADVALARDGRGEERPFN
jgi:hypothetical protein